MLEPDDNILQLRAEARLGAVLRNKWKLDRLLGVGGMAAVYEATHRNGARGAVKILHREFSVDPEARARFLQEGYVANKIRHPGTVAVLDDDVAEDGDVYLVMELLEGLTLHDLGNAQPGGQLGPAETLALADQLLDVLAAAHDVGIVHRDLKPENVFLTREGRLKILDFGLARVREVQGARLTRTGSGMGTPAFLPPEQAQGQWEKVDGRTDLWAAGATMFTLMTGRLVHEAPNVNQMLLFAMTRDAPRVRSTAPGIPKPVAAVIDRALRYERRERFADARSMQRAVRTALQGFPPVDLTKLVQSAQGFVPSDQGPGTLLSSTLSSHEPSKWPVRRSAGLTLAVAAVAAVAAIGALLALPRGSEPILQIDRPSPLSAAWEITLETSATAAPEEPPAPSSSATPETPKRAPPPPARPAPSADPFGDFK